MTVNWFWAEELVVVGWVGVWGGLRERVVGSVPDNSDTCAICCCEKCVVEPELVVFLSPSCEPR